MEITAAKWKHMKEKMNTQLALEKLYDNILRNMGSGVEISHLYELIQITSILWTLVIIFVKRDDNWTSLTGCLGKLNEIMHIDQLTKPSRYVINVSFYHWRITKIWET